MKIKFTRGDQKKVSFSIKDINGDEVILTPTMQLRFTAKVTTKTEQYLFQKKLGNGIVYDAGRYIVTIDPEDTETIDYGTFPYDIELRDDSIKYVKTLVVDSIILSDEATFKRNVV